VYDKVERSYLQKDSDLLTLTLVGSKANLTDRQTDKHGWKQNLRTYNI